MRRRILTLLAMTLLVTAALPTIPLDGRAHAGPALQKKKGNPGDKKGPGNKDGKDTVDGALWTFIATNRSGKRIRFPYRATDSILYDPDSGSAIGKVVSAGKQKSTVTFNKGTKFPATFGIQKEKVGYWTGSGKYDGDTWSIEVRAMDR